MFSCSDDNNLMDNGYIKGCENLQGKKISEIVDADAKLIIRGGPPMPLVLSEGTYIIGTENSDRAVLKIFNSPETSENDYFICNLPISIQKMGINTEGIDVVLSGNIFISEIPVSEGVYQYFELTKLKKK